MPTQLSTPANITYTFDSNSFNVTWDSVENASSYTVWISSDNIEEYMDSEYPTTNSTSMAADMFEGVDGYYVKVQACSSSDDYTDSELSSAVKLQAAEQGEQQILPSSNINAPTNISSCVENGKIKVSWDSVNNVTYKIYISSDNSEYLFYKDSESNNVIIDGSDFTGTSGYVKIKSVNLSNEMSDYSDTLTISLNKVNTPSFSDYSVKYDDGIDGIVFSPYVKNETNRGYYIYWKSTDDGDGVWRQTKKDSGNYVYDDYQTCLKYLYKDNEKITLKPGMTYVFKVKGVGYNNYLDGDFSSEYSVKVPPKKLETPYFGCILSGNFDTGLSIDVSFTKVSNASYYKLEYWLTGKKHYYYEIDESDCVLKNGILYYSCDSSSDVSASFEIFVQLNVRILAIGDIDHYIDSNCSSQVTLYSTGEPFVNMPANFNVTKTENKISATWNSVQHASSYKIDYSTNCNNWSSIENITSNELSNYSLDESYSSKDDIYFKIYAISNGDSNSDGTTYVDFLGSLLYKPSLNQGEVISKLNAPSLSCSVNLNNITVSWTAIDNASSYVLEMSDDGSTWTPYNLTECSKTFSALYYLKTYYFRCKAKNNDESQTSDYGTANATTANYGQFEMPSFSCSSSTSSSITIIYEDGYYNDIRIRWRVKDSNSDYSTSNVSNGIHIISGLTSGTIYEIGMQQYDSTNVCYDSNWNTQYAAVQMTLQKPSNYTIVSPVGTNTIKFNWTAVDHASGYAVYFSQDGTDYDNGTTVNTNSFTKTGLSQDTLYYFKIQTKGDGTTYLDSNDMLSFSQKTAAPSSQKLESPLLSLAIKDNQLAVQWTAVENADSYVLEYSSNANFSSPTETPVTGVEYLSVDFPITALYFRAKSKSESNVYEDSDWSSVITSDVDSPTNIVCEQVSASKEKISFTHGNNVSYYEILVGDNLNFNNCKTYKTTKNEYIVSELKSNKNYYVKIKAYSAGNIADESETASFKTGSFDDVIKFKLEDLSPLTTYYVKLYAVDNEGKYIDSEESEVVSFTTLGIIKSVDIIGDLQVEKDIEAVPSGEYNNAEISYKWYRMKENSDTEYLIANADSNIYTLTSDDFGYRIRVRLTSSNCSCDNVYNTTQNTVKQGFTASFEDNSGVFKFNCPIKVSVSPSDADVRYQWYKRKNNGDTWIDIDGETSNSYTPKRTDDYDDLGYYFKVEITGQNKCVGSEILTTSSRVVKNKFESVDFKYNVDGDEAAIEWDPLDEAQGYCISYYNNVLGKINECPSSRLTTDSKYKSESERIDLFIPKEGVYNSNTKQYEYKKTVKLTFGEISVFSLNPVGDEIHYDSSPVNNSSRWKSIVPWVSIKNEADYQVHFTRENDFIIEQVTPLIPTEKLCIVDWREDSVYYDYPDVKVNMKIEAKQEDESWEEVTVQDPISLEPVILKNKGIIYWYPIYYKALAFYKDSSKDDFFTKKCKGKELRFTVTGLEFITGSVTFTTKKMRSKYEDKEIKLNGPRIVELSKNGSFVDPGAFINDDSNAVVSEKEIYKITNFTNENTIESLVPHYIGWKKVEFSVTNEKVDSIDSSQSGLYVIVYNYRENNEEEYIDSAIRLVYVTSEFSPKIDLNGDEITTVNKDYYWTDPGCSAVDYNGASIANKGLGKNKIMTFCRSREGYDVEFSSSKSNKFLYTYLAIDNSMNIAAVVREVSVVGSKASLNGHVVAGITVGDVWNDPGISIDNEITYDYDMIVYKKNSKDEYELYEGDIKTDEEYCYKIEYVLKDGDIIENPPFIRYLYVLPKKANKAVLIGNNNDRFTYKKEWKDQGSYLVDYNNQKLSNEVIKIYADEYGVIHDNIDTSLYRNWEVNYYSVVDGKMSVPNYRTVYVQGWDRPVLTLYGSDKEESYTNEQWNESGYSAVNTDGSVDNLKVIIKYYKKQASGEYASAPFDTKTINIKEVSDSGYGSSDYLDISHSSFIGAGEYKIDYIAVNTHLNKEYSSETLTRYVTYKTPIQIAAPAIQDVCCSGNIVSLYWTALDIFDTFEVYYSKNADNLNNVVKTPYRSIAIKDLDIGSKYYFAVKGIDSKGKYSSSDKSAAKEYTVPVTPLIKISQESDVIELDYVGDKTSKFDKPYISYIYFGKDDYDIDRIIYKKEDGTTHWESGYKGNLVEFNSTQICDGSSIGNYVVSYSVSPLASNVNAYNQGKRYVNISVVDKAPLITLMGDDIIDNLYVGDEWEDPGILSISDVIDGTFSGDQLTDLIKERFKYSSSNNVDTSKAGTYYVKYEVTDSFGNKTEKTRKVIVHTNAPKVKLYGRRIQGLREGHSYIEQGAYAISKSGLVIKPDEIEKTIYKITDFGDGIDGIEDKLNRNNPELCYLVDYWKDNEFIKTKLSNKKVKTIDHQSSGIYIIRYEAKYNDDCYNEIKTSDSVFRMIFVITDQSPSISFDDKNSNLNQHQNVSLNVNEVWYDKGIIATEHISGNDNEITDIGLGYGKKCRFVRLRSNEDADIDVKSQDYEQDLFNTNETNAYICTYIAIDNNGNASVIIRIITVTGSKLILNGFPECGVVRHQKWVDPGLLCNGRSFYDYSVNVEYKCMEASLIKENPDKYIKEDESGGLYTDFIELGTGENLIDTSIIGVYKLTYIPNDTLYEDSIIRYVYVTDKDNAPKIVMNSDNPDYMIVNGEYKDQGAYVVDQNNNPIKELTEKKIYKSSYGDFEEIEKIDTSEASFYYITYFSSKSFVLVLEKSDDEDEGVDKKIYLSYDAIPVTRTILPDSWSAPKIELNKTDDEKKNGYCSIISGSNFTDPGIKVTSFKNDTLNIIIRIMIYKIDEDNEVKCFDQYKEYNYSNKSYAAAFNNYIKTINYPDGTYKIEYRAVDVNNNKEYISEPVYREIRFMWGAPKVYLWNADDLNNIYLEVDNIKDNGVDVKDYSELNKDSSISKGCNIVAKYYKKNSDDTWTALTVSNNETGQYKHICCKDYSDENNKEKDFPVSDLFKFSNIDYDGSLNKNVVKTNSYVGPGTYKVEYTAVDSHQVKSSNSVEKTFIINEYWPNIECSYNFEYHDHLISKNCTDYFKWAYDGSYQEEQYFIGSETNPVTYEITDAPNSIPTSIDMKNWEIGEYKIKFKTPYNIVNKQSSLFFDITVKKPCCEYIRFDNENDINNYCKTHYVDEDASKRYSIVNVTAKDNGETCRTKCVIYKKNGSQENVVESIDWTTIGVYRIVYYAFPKIYNTSIDNDSTFYIQLINNQYYRSVEVNIEIKDTSNSMILYFDDGNSNKVNSKTEHVRYCVDTDTIENLRDVQLNWICYDSNGQIVSPNKTKSELTWNIVVKYNNETILTSQYIDVMRLLHNIEYPNGEIITDYYVNSKNIGTYEVIYTASFVNESSVTVTSSAILKIVVSEDIDLDNIVIDPVGFSETIKQKVGTHSLPSSFVCKQNGKNCKIWGGKYKYYKYTNYFTKACEATSLNSLSLNQNLNEGEYVYYKIMFYVFPSDFTSEFLENVTSGISSYNGRIFTSIDEFGEYCISINSIATLSYDIKIYNGDTKEVSISFLDGKTVRSESYYIEPVRSSIEFPGIAIREYWKDTNETIKEILFTSYEDFVNSKYKDQILWNIKINGVNYGGGSGNYYSVINVQNSNDYVIKRYDNKTVVYKIEYYIKIDNVISNTLTRYVSLEKQLNKIKWVKTFQQDKYSGLKENSYYKIDVWTYQSLIDSSYGDELNAPYFIWKSSDYTDQNSDTSKSIGNIDLSSEGEYYIVYYAFDYGFGYSDRDLSNYVSINDYWKTKVSEKKYIEYKIVHLRVNNDNRLKMIINGNEYSSNETYYLFEGTSNRNDDIKVVELNANGSEIITYDSENLDDITFSYSVTFNGVKVIDSWTTDGSFDSVLKKTINGSNIINSNNEGEYVITYKASCKSVRSPLDKDIILDCYYTRNVIIESHKPDMNKFYIKLNGDSPDYVIKSNGVYFDPGVTAIDNNYYQNNSNLFCHVERKIYDSNNTKIDSINLNQTGEYKIKYYAFPSCFIDNNNDWDYLITKGLYKMVERSVTIIDEDDANSIYSLSVSLTPSYDANTPLEYKVNQDLSRAYTLSECVIDIYKGIGNNKTKEITVNSDNVKFNIDVTFIPSYNGDITSTTLPEMTGFKSLNELVLNNAYIVKTDKIGSYQIKYDLSYTYEGSVLHKTVYQYFNVVNNGYDTELVKLVEHSEYGKYDITTESPVIELYKN